VFARMQIFIRFFILIFMPHSNNSNLVKNSKDFMIHLFIGISMLLVGIFCVLQILPFSGRMLITLQFVSFGKGSLQWRGFFDDAMCKEQEQRKTFFSVEKILPSCTPGIRVIYCFPFRKRFLRIQLSFSY